MAFLFGSAPKAQQLPPTPTISPAQSQLLSMLSSMLQTGTAPQGTTGGGYITPAQSGIVNELAGAAGQVPGVTSAVPAAAQQAILQALGFQAPQVAAPAATGPAPVATPAAPPAVVAPNINAAAAFQTGVADPLLQDFSSRVLPSISGAAGRSAGGAYSSDTQLAEGRATQDLGRTLAQQASLYDLAAQTANQSANLTASQANAANALTGSAQGLQAGIANQGTDLATRLANLQSQIGTNQLNVGSALGGESALTTAAGAAPGVAYGPGADFASVLNSLLQGVSLPTNEANFLSQLAGSTGTAATQTGNTAVLPGQTGLLPSLLGSLAGNQGLGTAVGTALFSDEDLKSDMELVGKLDNGLPIYTFRYKDDPANVTRLGLKAQDVEQVNPAAVVTLPSGFKAVDYRIAALTSKKAA